LAADQREELEKVLAIALERQPVPLTEEDVAPATAVASAETVVDPVVVKH